jgi:hypothetical protein
MSSKPTVFAGQNPTAARAFNHPPSKMRESIFCASAKSAFAVGPTLSSSRINGYVPTSSHVRKNGVQSMYLATARRSILSNARTPKNRGTGGA